MQFKIFPAWIVEGRKVPLIKGWNESATTDPEQIAMWQNLLRDKLQIWGIPCGSVNDILVLDFDAKDGGLETLKTLQLPETLNQRTRSGGIHYFYRCPRDGRTYGNRVKFLRGTDIRGERGWAAYYGFANPGTAIADAPQWLLDEALKEPVQPTAPGQAVAVDPTFAEKIINESLDKIREAAPGEANNTLNVEAFRLGQLVAGGTITWEYAYSALFRAGKERGKSDYECKATIESGLKGGMQKPLTSPFGAAAPAPSITIPPPPGPPPRWTPSYLTREQVLDFQHLKKPQLFEHWSTEDISITTADGGTGKTTLMLYQAVCAALGQPFLGFNCLQPGAKTLYIIGEDSEKKYAAMIGQILRQMGLLQNFPGFPDRVQQVLQSVVLKRDLDLCLIVKERNGIITPNGDALRKISEAIEDINPKVVVLDPISSFWGSESALNDMNRAVSKLLNMIVDKYGVSIEMINHMGKASSATKDMTQFAGRGGSGLPSNSRVSRVIRPIDAEEYTDLTNETLGDGQSAMMCVVNKFSDGSPLFNRPFLIIRHGYLFTRKDLSEVKVREAEKQLGDIERVFAFIKQARTANKFPSLPVVIGHFMDCGNPISEARTKRAIKMLGFSGYMGEFVREIENPDVTIKDRVFIVVDGNGKEH